MYKAMPDLHLTIEDIIVCRNIWRWTDSASGQKIYDRATVRMGGAKASPILKMAVLGEATKSKWVR